MPRSRTVIKAVTPGPLRFKAMMAAIREGLQEGGEMLLKQHERVTRTWKPPVDFDMKVSRVWPIGRSASVTITTEDVRWIWTDLGTKPHMIRPKKAPRLVFPTAFSPKSKPRSLRARKGYSGGPLAYAMEVHHPGTTPRLFTETIRKKYGPKFQKIMDKAMADAARASGQGA